MKREEVLAVLTRLIQCAARDYEKWDRLSGNQLVAMLRQDRAAREVIASALDDAERYRWLRDNCYINRIDDRETPHAVIAVCVGAFHNGIGWMHPGHPPGVGIPSLDTAVDTARAAAAGGEGVL